MATAYECYSRAQRRIEENTNELQREALAAFNSDGFSYWFSDKGMHITQRGRKYTITPFGAVWHGV